MRRLVSSVLALSLLATSAPAFAADPAAVSIEIPCTGTSGKARARCITDSLKSWKVLEKEYDELEDDLIDQWKKDHVSMGVGSDYQKALRDFLNGVRADRKAFQKQLNEFRKEFFDEQKTKRAEGDGRAATQVKLEKSKLEAAKAVCGPEDDDGAFRICMRIQLRVKATNVDKRSRSTNKLLGK